MLTLFILGWITGALSGVLLFLLFLWIDPLSLKTGPTKSTEPTRY